MGTILTTIEVENPRRPGARLELPNTVVDSAKFATWIPRAVLEALDITVQRRMEFLAPEGLRIDRDIGYALVRAGGSEAPDFVVFAEPGDPVVLGWHSLAGLNLKIDPVRKELVYAGPIIASAVA